MRVFLFLILLSVGLNSFSQKLDSAEQNAILQSISSMDLEIEFNQIIDSCNKYLTYNFTECHLRSGLFYWKALALKTKYLLLTDSSWFYWAEDEQGDEVVSVSYEKRKTEFESVIIELLDSAIKNCPDCKVNYILEKYYMNQYTCENNISELEFTKLQEFGFKETLNFLGFTPQFFYGTSQWVGFEVATKVLQSRYKMKNISSSPMYSLTGPTLGFRKNISKEKGWGMNISAASASWYWINFRPINFSYLNNGENKSWGYAPELGFQIWHFHLNAGYNLAFKKSMRNYEKLYFTAKIDIPIYRF